MMIVTDLSSVLTLVMVSVYAFETLDAFYIPYAETRHEQDDCLLFLIFWCWTFFFFVVVNHYFFLLLFFSRLVRVMLRYGRHFLLSDSGVETSP